MDCGGRMKCAYAIKAPSGELLWDTVASNRNLAWQECYYRHLYKQYAYEETAHRAAYRNGWRCVPCSVHEIKK